MAVKFLDNTGLGYFWGKIKAWCNSTFAAIAHTHTSYAVKHSYTTAANAAKNWYRIANANTSQTDTTKPIHAQFILTAYNTSYDAGYYERWFINAEVFGRNAHIVILGNATAPFSQARILYENTIANLDANDRPAIDIYLNYQLANGTTKIEIEEVYNQGWTFLANGQLATSSIPSGFESVASTIRNNGIDRSTTADYASYLNRQISNITAAFTLADSYLYRSRTLNCTGTFTITIPSINSGYMWCVIKNKNTSSGVITLHPSTTSVLIDGSNADITLQPMEYVCIHSAGANNYSLIADGRWKSQKADKATTLAGYGITDAKIANGTITLGSNSITPLTSVPSHNQASNTINAMTGYSKPNSTSAITASDTLNSAIGKLEKAIDDADISNVIHATGNETINGIKEFSNLYYDSTREGEENYESSSLIIRHATYEKGTAPITNHYHANLVFLSKTGNNINWGGRLGLVENRIMPDNQNYMVLGSIKNEIIDGVDTRDSANLAVGYDDNGEKFCTCPSTSTTRTQDYDVITRDFIPKDTRIVHTTDDETIAGSKIFSSSIKSTASTLLTRTLENISIADTSRSSTINTMLVQVLDNSSKRFGGIEVSAKADGGRSIYFTMRNRADNGWVSGFSLVELVDGTVQQHTQTPSDSSNSTEAASTAWVRKYCETTKGFVTLTGAQTITGSKTFSSDIILNASSPDILFYNSTLTKGTNPSETMWNEVLFCDKTGNRDSAYRMGQLAANVNTDGKTSVELHAYNWVSGSTANSSIGIAYPKNGTPYTWAPTPATSDNSTKMATTAFVKAQGYLTSHQSLDSCVKTSGAQTVGGIKTFTASPEIKRDNPYIYFIETDQTKWTSANNAYQGLFFCDKNTSEIASVLALNYANEGALRLYTYSKGSSFGNTYLELNGAGSGTNAKTFSPYPTKGCSLGNSSHLYTQLYANTTTISTSDEKEKSNIENISDEILDAWEEVSFCSFQFNDALAQKGEAARIHSGLVSQRVHEIFSKHSLDGFRYAFLCRDQGEAIDRDEKQPDGTMYHFHEDAYDNWGVRYEEALCIEAAYQRRKNKILENRISELERQVSDMLQILQSLKGAN